MFVVLLFICHTKSVTMNMFVQNFLLSMQSNCPFEIADRMNIHIKHVELPRNVRGFYFFANNHGVIALNNRLSPAWQRFVCAHEIGHHVLHPHANRFFWIAIPHTML